ncbi:hypothetical protein Hanom_Chr02g00100941 [Helianthus anomalus]
MKKTQFVYINIFLIGYIHINTNIGPLKKLFLRFRLVINPFGIRFRPLVSQIPNFVRPKGTFFRARTRYTNSQGRPWREVARKCHWRLLAFCATF